MKPLFLIALTLGLAKTETTYDLVIPAGRSSAVGFDAALKEVSKADPLSVYLDTSKAPIANGAHYNTKGTLQVGQQLAEALLKLTP